jgi:tetrahydromethanopterin S-methyltransferase subunit G
MRRTKYLMIVILALLSFTFISCNNKNTPINELEELSEDIKENSKNYTDDDWAAISQSLEDIEAELEEHRTEYTEADQEKIGRLKGICVAYFTRYAVKSVSTEVRDGLRQLNGALDGIKEVLDNDSDFFDVEK